MRVRQFGIIGVLIAFVSSFSLASCTEDVDDSNLAIKTKPTMIDFVSRDSSLTLINRIFERVLLDNSDTDEEAASSGASSLSAALSARGNYTLFAPTDDAVRAYCDSIINTTDVDALSYEQAKLIAFSCIIDNGDNSAYESALFPTTGTFNLTNLYDRLLTCVQDASAEYIVGGSLVTSADHEVSNGFVHKVNRVIAPSAQSVTEMISVADNMKIMGHLLEVTGIGAKLGDILDDEYEDNVNRPETRYWSTVYKSGVNNWPVPTRRYLGYTAFVETDEVFQNDWNIQLTRDANGEVTNWDEVMSIVKSKVEPVYKDALSTDDLTNPDNAVNRFVAYHFLKGRIAYNKFVHHFNEHLYDFGADRLNPQTINYTVDIWDYYTTIDMGSDGRRGLVKVLQVPTGEHEIYLNRVANYDNELVGGTYQELGLRFNNNPGVNGLNIQIAENNGANDNNALNGFYYPIDHVLLYDVQTRQAIASERMRIDVTTILPEVITNNFRGVDGRAFLNGYFENVTNETEGTEIYYLQQGANGVGDGWRDYEGDEFIFSGMYDFVLRLPPVPDNGTYEIRFGASNNELRGMCQIYFGDEPDKTTPVGLPFDLRQNAIDNPEIPFVKDSEYDYDEEQIIENDKDLRNHGWMKAPKYFWTSNRSSVVRDLGGDSSPALRKIITVQQLDANKNYYLRFKSALKKLDSQFYFDYFEIVPKSVYDGTTQEDAW